MDTLELLRAVNATTKKSEKLALVKANITQVFRDMYEDCYNDKVNYYLTDVNSQSSGHKTLEDYAEWHSALQKLANREIVGDNARTYMELVISDYESDTQKWLRRVLARDMLIGFSYKTYRKEILGLKAKEFEVTLAQKIQDQKNVNVLDGSYWASRKCDGCRCVARIDCDSKEVKFISRQNKEFEVLDNLKPAVLKYIGNRIGVWYLDGELCKVDENGDENFSAIMQEIRRKNYSITECCYQLFDIVTEDEFLGNKVSANFTERYADMKELERAYNYNDPTFVRKGCWIKVLKQELIKSQEDFDKWKGYVAEGGWEGFMLRKDCPFEVGRTKNLLKVKEYDDAEFTVEGVVKTTNATMAIIGEGNKQVECVKSLTIRYKGNIVEVGGGLTRQQRLDWLANPSLIIGKTICVQYFGETMDIKTKLPSLRFPILKYVYENGRDC